MRPALPGHLPSPEEQYIVEQRPEETLFPTEGAAALSVKQAVPGRTPGTWEGAHTRTSPAGLRAAAAVLWASWLGRGRLRSGSSEQGGLPIPGL